MNLDKMWASIGIILLIISLAMFIYSFSFTDYSQTKIKVKEDCKHQTDSGFLGGNSQYYEGDCFAYDYRFNNLPNWFPLYFFIMAITGIFGCLGLLRGILE